MAPKEPIIGKVAGVEDEHTILINKGEQDGVKLGTVFSVESSENARPVKDPDTGDIIGYRPKETLDVRVREVYDRFSVAETFRSYSWLDPQIAAFTEMGPLTRRYRDRISGPEATSKTPQQRAVQVTVNIGDIASEVLEKS